MKNTNTTATRTAVEIQAQIMEAEQAHRRTVDALKTEREQLGAKQAPLNRLLQDRAFLLERITTGKAQQADFTQRTETLRGAVKGVLGKAGDERGLKLEYWAGVYHTETLHAPFFLSVVTEWLGERAAELANLDAQIIAMAKELGFTQFLPPELGGPTV